MDLISKLNPGWNDLCDEIITQLTQNLLFPQISQKPQIIKIDKISVISGKMNLPMRKVSL